MGQPAEQLQHRATAADLDAVPPHQIAELIQGTLHIFSRPGPVHTNAASSLGGELTGPFQRGRGGPGGWWILDEPELRFPDPEAPGEVEALVPDLAGWRVERMPDLPEEAFFAIAPDWICEVLSPLIEAHDRTKKMPIYAREGVSHAWLVNPITRTLEAYALLPDRRWLLVGAYHDTATVRVEPLEATELDLSVLWSRPVR